MTLITKELYSHKNLDGAIAVDFEHALEMAKQLLADKDFMNKHVDPCAHK